MNLMAATILDWIDQMPVYDRAWMLVVFGAFAVLLIIVITVAVSKTICRVQKNRLEDSLKRELVDRGFSVEEIERIVQASAGKTARRSAT